MALERVYCGVAAAEMPPWLTVAVVDDSGRLLDLRHVSDDPLGYAELGALLADRSPNPAPVAFDRGDRLITQLLAAASRPIAIADEATASDFAERFSDDSPYSDVRAPLDQRQAIGLARGLQLGALYPTAQGPSWNMDEFKPVLAAHGALTTGRQAAASALREVLHELYPAALRAYPDPANPISLRILDALPDPGMLTPSPSSHQRESALVAEITASGVAEYPVVANAITALRVAVDESPRWGNSRQLGPMVAETVRQAVAAVRACDAASASLMAAVAGRLNEYANPTSGSGYYLPHQAEPVSAAPRYAAGPAAEVPMSRLAPRTSAASAAASGVPAPGYAGMAAGLDLPTIPAPRSAPGYDTQGYETQGYDQRGYDQQGHDQQAYDQQAYDQQAYDQRAYDQQQAYQQQAYQQQGYDQSSYGNPGYAEAQYNGAAQYSDGYAQPGGPPPGYTQHDYGQPGYPEPSHVSPAFGGPVHGPGHGAPAPGAEWPGAQSASAQPASAPPASEPPAPQYPLSQAPPYSFQDATATTLSFALDPLNAPLAPPPAPEPARAYEPTRGYPEPALNGNGQSNGGSHTNGSTHANGHTTGATNGATAANGHANGDSHADGNGSGPRDGDLLIFADMRSAWFMSEDEFAAATEPPAWGRLADDGWKAAEHVAHPSVGVATDAGLPRRVPQANLVPGSAQHPPRQLRIVRDARSIATHTEGYFRGWRRGQEIGGFAIGQRDRAAWEFNRDQRAREAAGPYDQRTRLS